MRKMVAVVMCTVILSGLAACGKEPEDSKSIRDILEQQQYMEVTLGESYHQEKVLFDVMGQRAVIPKDTKWGRQEFREKDVTGIFYGAQEGGERYRTNLQDDTGTLSGVISEIY